MALDLVEKLADKLGDLFALQEERTRSLIAAGMAETKNALRLRGARPIALSGSGTQSIYAGSGRLVGWSIYAGGTASVVSVYDGRPDSYAPSDVVAVISIDAGKSVNHTTPGVSITEACTVVVTGGAVAGALYLGAKD